MGWPSEFKNSLGRGLAFEREVRSLLVVRFDALADEHKRLGMNLLEGVARMLAIRLRRANVELRALQDS